MRAPFVAGFATALLAVPTFGYEVQTPPLDTPWTYELGTNPWPQHPRPQLKREAWQSLNGIWTYRAAQGLDAVNSPPSGQLDREVKD